MFCDTVFKYCLVLYNPDMKDFLCLISRYYSRILEDYFAIHSYNTIVGVEKSSSTKPAKC